ncbi:MAG TPA: hypothetical protein VK427_16975 [Kofleriaceae bacterium]|nr:hypothetical protein [Kofleriaceae bacterium]
MRCLLCLVATVSPALAEWTMLTEPPRSPPTRPPSVSRWTALAEPPRRTPHAPVSRRRNKQVAKRVEASLLVVKRAPRRVVDPSEVVLPNLFSMASGSTFDVRYDRTGDEDGRGAMGNALVHAQHLHASGVGGYTRVAYSHFGERMTDTAVVGSGNGITNAEAGGMLRLPMSRRWSALVRLGMTFDLVEKPIDELVRESAAVLRPLDYAASGGQSMWARTLVQLQYADPGVHLGVVVSADSPVAGAGVRQGVRSDVGAAIAIGFGNRERGVAFALVFRGPVSDAADDIEGSVVIALHQQLGTLGQLVGSIGVGGPADDSRGTALGLALRFPR